MVSPSFKVTSQSKTYVTISSRKSRTSFRSALPILDWVWFGVYRTEECAGIYTYGMRKFGKEEMEVYAANADRSEERRVGSEERV